MKINKSIGQIMQSNSELGAMFYEHLLTHYPELQQHFQKVDQKRLSSLSVTALMIIERHLAQPTPTTDLYLQHLGTRHHDLRVPKDAFGVWVKAMLETMQNFHDQGWTSQLEDQWRQAFDGAIEIMFRGYDQRVTV